MEKILRFKPFEKSEVKVLVDSALGVDGTGYGLHFTFSMGPEDRIAFRKRPEMDRCVFSGVGVFRECASFKLLIASSDAFDSRICLQFYDLDGNPIGLGSAGSVLHMAPEAAIGNPAEFTLFYSEGKSRIFSMGASSAERRDLVFALISDDDDAFQWAIRVAWLGYRSGVGTVLKELGKSDLFMLPEDGANDDNN